MKRTVLTVLAMACVLGWASLAMGQEKDAPKAADQPKVEIPTTKVVLYSSGVGYFEHNGQVDGDAVSQIQFKADQINDVLKSMVLFDYSGGNVTSVNYAPQEPLIRALKSFGVDISGDPTFADLLKQLRGAEVTVQTTDKTVGKVLSVEVKEKRITDGGVTTIIKDTVLNLVTDKGIQAVDMGSVKSITLKDERLSGELNKALELLIASHDTARKPVEIHFAGKGKRDVRIGYMAETPVWKTSYRLTLSGEKPLIQGWAIVENTSDNDWNKVNLELVSGRPISFIQDLYTPLYMPRPVVVPDLYASLRPQLYEEGMDKAGELRKEAKRMAGDKGKDDMALEQAEGRLRGAPAAPGSGGAAQAARGYYDGKAPTGEVDLSKSVQSAASAGKMGELFNFRIKDPVDLPRRRSAMLPIINQAIKAEKVSIYNAAVLPRNPLNGAWLTNDTEMKLLGGPVTVFDDGAYAGDARIDNLVPSEKRLISYAIDLNVTVDPSAKEDQAITGIKIVRGTLEVSHLHTYTQTYLLRNKGDNKKTLIIEHPIVNQERKLIDPAKFEEKTPTLYRFKVELDKNMDKAVAFVVKEEQVVRQAVGILNESVDTLLYYSKTGKLSGKVAEAIAKAVELKNKAAALQKQLADLTAQLNDLTKKQERLREDIKVVGKDSDMGRRYVEKLSKQEDEIDKLEPQIDDLRKQVQAAQKALADYLQELSID
ncbi:MAG: hypothetical protein ACE15C_10425 [Phycisphaerae bacterium]